MSKKMLIGWLLVIAALTFAVGTSYANDLSPIAVISGDPCVIASVGETVYFDGSNSYDPDGGFIIDYEWTFPDGAYYARWQGADTAKCKFDTAGQYYVYLKVKDDEGWLSTNNEYVTVTVSAAVSSTWWPDPQKLYHC